MHVPSWCHFSVERAVEWHGNNFVIVLVVIIIIDDDIRLLVIAASEQELRLGPRLLQQSRVALQGIAGIGDDRHGRAVIQLLILIVLNYKVAHHLLGGVVAIGPLACCILELGPLSVVNLFGSFLLLMPGGLGQSTNTSDRICRDEIVILAGSSAHCHLVVSRPVISVGLRTGVNLLVLWDAELLLGVLELALD